MLSGQKMGRRLLGELQPDVAAVRPLQRVRKRGATILEVLIDDLEFTFQLNLLIQRSLQAAGCGAKLCSRVSLRGNAAPDQTANYDGD
jgi:hypothetical protein